MKTYQILIYSFIGLLLLAKKAIAQDTIYLDPKIEYFSNRGDSYEDLKKYKAFPKFSREIIKTLVNSYKIERCYYFDSKRNASTNVEYFKIINDSILFADNEKWSFRRQSNNIFFVYRKDSCFTERGIAYSIIPFVKNGKFVTLNKQNDTLLIEQFEMGKYIYSITPKVVFKDSVFVKVDELPRFPSKYGDLQTYIAFRLIYPVEFAEASIQGKVYLKVVITSEGFVRNIEVLRGVDPLLDKEALRVISKLPEFEPAKKNSKNVNAYYTIPVRFVLK